MHTLEDWPTCVPKGCLTTLKAIVFSLGLSGLSQAVATPPECAPPAPGEPVFITADCLDPLYTMPSIDIEEWRDTPVRHYYVNGHFERPATGEPEPRFSFYFPEPDRYEGRFFHFSNAIPGSENAPSERVEFALESGAYFVQTNGGGGGLIAPLGDNSIPGYRVDAAAAKYSRLKASEIYGYQHDPYGYRYGGSGGGYKTIAGAENSSGVWDGNVPFIIGSPMALPNVYSIRGHALRNLRREDACPALIDAVEPGSNGNLAGLSQEARSALEEATRFGFPPRAWFECETMALGALPLIAPLIESLDPGYFDDFWTTPGYLGADSSSSIHEDRVQFSTRVDMHVPVPSPLPPVYPGAVRLENAPTTGDLTSFDLVITSGSAAGQKLPATALIGDIVVFNFTANPAVIAAIQAGDDVVVDNSDALAMQTYHRHQDPAYPRPFGFQDDDFRVWDQFRDDDGQPLYPQRATLAGPQVTGTGTVQNGQINGKMIVVETLMDIDALPWQADWYRKKVVDNLGRFTDKQFRLYFIDNADHGSTVRPSRQTHLVQFRGVLQQALLDVSAWAEHGIKPPDSTRYQMVHGLPRLPQQAGARKGIQPVVELRANGGERAEVSVGEPVRFQVKVQAPPKSGDIIDVEWDFEGTGDYVSTSLRHNRRAVVQRETHVYSTPGTYFPGVRGSSHRDGDGETPWALIQNLDRVRVVVHP